jgi:HK97 family phage prohead protease
MEYKRFKFEVKAVEEDGSFSGYASVFGNRDLDDDIVVKGAFKRTIDASGGVVPILWQHDTKNPIGWNVTAAEDDHGLKVDGQLLLEDSWAKKALEWMKLGLKLGGKVGLSIGYEVIQKATDKGVRYLKELKLMEYSIVTFAANTAAMATEAKGLVTFQDLPIADKSRGWDAGAARGRVKLWAGGENIDWEKYRKAFLSFDADKPEDLSSYQFPTFPLWHSVCT